MYGVSKINIEPSLMMISVQDVEFKGNSLARYLQIFADNGVVVDMISQSAPHGTTIDFSFTAAGSDLPLVMKAISAANLDKDAKASPLISVGYSKLNLFGEDMVTSCGVAARALNALAMAGIEVLLITTSDLDICITKEQQYIRRINNNQPRVTNLICVVEARYIQDGITTPRDKITRGMQSKFISTCVIITINTSEGTIRKFNNSYPTDNIGRQISRSYKHAVKNRADWTKPKCTQISFITIL